MDTVSSEREGLTLVLSIPLTTAAVCHSQLGWDCEVLESSPLAPATPTTAFTMEIT